MKRRRQDDKQAAVRMSEPSESKLLIELTQKLEQMTLIAFVVVGLLILATRT